MNNEDVMDRTLDEADELYHYGVPGMKWGVRRTPAQLGHKTGSKKRRTKAKAYVEKLMKQHKAKKDAKKAADEERKRDLERQNKPISKMSDAELAQYVARKNAERTAYSLQRDIEALNPKKVSAGKRFAAGFRDKATSALVDGAGKLMNNFVNKAVEKALGNGAVDPLMKLKKEADAAGYNKIKSEAKKAAIEAMEKEYNFKQRVERDRAKAEESSANKKSGLFGKMADKAEADAAESNAASSRRRAGWEYTAKNVASDITFDSPTTQAQRTSGQQYLESRKNAGLLNSPIAGYLPAPKDDD